jgi:uncharacterized protein YuzE
MKISYDKEVDAVYIKLIDNELTCRTLRLNEDIALNIVSCHIYNDGKKNVISISFNPPLKGWVENQCIFDLTIGANEKLIGIEILDASYVLANGNIPDVILENIKYQLAV